MPPCMFLIARLVQKVIGGAKAQQPGLRVVGLIDQPLGHRGPEAADQAMFFDRGDNAKSLEGFHADSLDRAA